MLWFHLTEDIGNTFLIRELFCYHYSFWIFHVFLIVFEKRTAET